MSAITVIHHQYDWNVEGKVDGGDRYRYRYRCNMCGHTGPWRVNGNDADAGNHMWRAHKIGD